MRIQRRPPTKLLRQGQRPRPSKRASKDSDRVTLSEDRWYTPAVNLAKSIAMAGAMGAGLATAGLIGGIPAVGIAAVTGLIAGGAVRPSRFSGTNALGCFTSFGAAALFGVTGPLGIVGGGALMAGLCLNSALLTDQQQFG